MKTKPKKKTIVKPARTVKIGTHGGARENSGRKPKAAAEKRKARLLMLTDVEKKKVDAMRGNKSFSAYVRAALGLEA